MSNWTSIHATIHADFGNETKYFIEQFFAEIKDKEYSLGYDPKKKGDGCEITGSEMNAVVTYAPLKYFEMDPRNRYFRDNEWVITVSGNLRDRRFEDTLAEWSRFAWKFGMFLRKCKNLDGNANDDNTFREATLGFWSVDITGYSSKKGDFVHYFRSSRKDQINV